MVLVIFFIHGISLLNYIITEEEKFQNVIGVWLATVVDLGCCIPMVLAAYHIYKTFKIMWCHN